MWGFPDRADHAFLAGGGVGPFLVGLVLVECDRVG